MTHTKANKSKILALILGLAMCIALMLGIIFASGATTAFAGGEPDTRIPISTITATSNIDDIVGYMKSVVLPTLDIKEGLPVNLGTHRWKKYDGSEWIWNEDDIFVEGKYRYEVQIRTDNTTHVLDKNGVTLTVNGENWTEKGGSIWIGDDYSWDWFYSREYEITKPTTVAITEALVSV